MARSKGAFKLARTGKTQQAIADELRCDITTVGKWLLGKNQPSTAMCDLIEARFNIPSDDWGVPMTVTEAPPTPRNTSPVKRPGAYRQVLPPEPPEPGTRPHLVVPELPRPAPLPTEHAQTVHERAIATEKLVDQLMRDANEAIDLTPIERAKVVSQLTTTLTHLRRLKGEEISELKIVQHPAWIRFQKIMVDALKPWPDAIRAVLAAVAEQENR